MTLHLSERCCNRNSVVIEISTKLEVCKTSHATKAHPDLKPEGKKHTVHERHERQRMIKKERQRGGERGREKVRKTEKGSQRQRA